MMREHLPRDTFRPSALAVKCITQKAGKSQISEIESSNLKLQAHLTPRSTVAENKIEE
jgi:hypothetical protein